MAKVAIVTVYQTSEGNFLMNNSVISNNSNIVSIESANKKPYLSNPVYEKKEDNIALIDNYLKQLDWKVRENSNMSYSIQGLNNYIASEVSKTYWLHKIYNEKIRNAHLSGDIHIHDLNIIAVYCVGWDLKDLLMEGFQGVKGKVESAPAKHFRTALGQVVNFMYTMQGEAAGAQAFSNFDTLLAPFIRYDKLSYEQVKQSMQEFVFNMNVPTRVGQFTVAMDQMIYAPDLVTNILVKHKKLKFEKAEKVLTEQNIGLQTGYLYLDVLMFENMIKVQEEALKALTCI